MAEHADRLVKRIQQQHTRAFPARPGRVHARDVAELKSRVRRLRAVSDAFAHVTLSEYVEPHGTAESSVRKGAACVATDG